jgi:hypothetical protein
MKNIPIREIAAMFNYYLLVDMPDRYKGEDFENRMPLDLHQDTVPNELRTDFTIGDEFGVFWRGVTNTNHEGNKTYAIHSDSTVLVKRKSSEVLCMLRKNKKKQWYLHPLWAYYHMLLTKKMELPKEPNYMGVITKKKLDAWLDYCEEYVKRARESDETIKAANEAIEKEIADFIEDAKPKHSRYSNTIDLDTKLFSVRYTLNKDDGTCERKIKFKGTVQAIVDIEYGLKLVAGMNV